MHRTVGSFATSEGTWQCFPRVTRQQTLLLRTTAITATTSTSTTVMSTLLMKSQMNCRDLHFVASHTNLQSLLRELLAQTLNAKHMTHSQSTAQQQYAAMICFIRFNLLLYILLDAEHMPGYIGCRFLFRANEKKCTRRHNVDDSYGTNFLSKMNTTYSLQT